MAKVLKDYFKNIVLMSGTPDFKQIDLTNKNKANECACSPKMAMDNGWICKPTLNLIDCCTDAWPSAVKAVFEHELSIWEKTKLFKPVILVNCNAIEHIDKLRNTPWFKERTGNKFHFISIHSPKKVKNANDYSVTNVLAEIDGKPVDSCEAYAAVESIDSNSLFKDDLPVIVAQVQMIGEGINVKSFNAVITASSSEKTIMQQIGRGIRNFEIEKTVKKLEPMPVLVEKTKPGLFNKIFNRKMITTEMRDVEVDTTMTFTKVRDGHANVYVLNDNLDDVVQLISNLDQFELTDHCWQWGKRVDINEGAAVVHGEDKDFCEAKKIEWLDISETDPDIIEILNKAKAIIRSKANRNWVVNNEDNDGDGIPDVVELRELVNSESKKNFKEAYIGKGKKTDADIFRSLMGYIIDKLHEPVCKKLWHKNKRVFLFMVFTDKDVVDFFLEHLSKKQIAQLDAI